MAPRTVNDLERKRQLADILRLRLPANRMDPFSTDEAGHRFILKTTTTNDVTTARDMGPRYIDNLRQSYLVVAQGALDDVQFRILECWVLTPIGLGNWIQEKEAKYKGNRILAQRVIAQLAGQGFTDSDVKMVQALLERGMTENNPTISMAYVRQHGFRVQGVDPHRTLRAIVASNPIP